MEPTAAHAPSARLTELPQADIGSLASILPDTPWTTTAVQACERRLARAWVDSSEAPQCAAVLLGRDPEGAQPGVAYLFGSGNAPDALIAWVEQQQRPLEVVCDDEVGVALHQAHPEAEIEDVAAHWFERLDSVERPEASGVRRLRLKDAEAVAALEVPGLLTSFETLKDLLMVGGAAAVVEDGEIVAAAFTIDQTVNYARVLAFTVESRRRQGLAGAACQFLVAAHHEQGRLACGHVAAGDAAGAALARSIGFESSARVRRYRLA
jgi:hypothetical protein